MVAAFWGDLFSAPESYFFGFSRGSVEVYLCHREKYLYKPTVLGDIKSMRFSRQCGYSDGFVVGAGELGDLPWLLLSVSCIFSADRALSFSMDLIPLASIESTFFITISGCIIICFYSFI